MESFQTFIRDNHPDLFQEEKYLLPLPIRHWHQPPSLFCWYSTVKQREIGKDCIDNKVQYGAYRDGISQDNWTNVHPEGEENM